MERVAALNDEPGWLRSCLRKREKKIWREREVENLDKFSVSGKIPKTPGMTKN